jgi:hypothetical protein
MTENRKSILSADTHGAEVSGDVVFILLGYSKSVLV